ncbi:hypothetical protein NL676_005499 [Syzygium grande]|nr:hypothetical protein NL676_005499 [Syzygium grande]
MAPAPGGPTRRRCQREWLGTRARSASSAPGVGGASGSDLRHPPPPPPKGVILCGRPHARRGCAGRGGGGRMEIERGESDVDIGSRGPHRPPPGGRVPRKPPGGPAKRRAVTRPNSEGHAKVARDQTD